MNDHSKLDDLRTQRREAQTRLDEAIAKFTEAQGIEAEALKKLVKCEAVHAAATTELAYRAADAKLAEAKTSHGWTKRVVDQAQDARDRAKKALEAVHASLVDEAQRVLEAEVEVESGEYNRAYDALARRHAALMEKANPFSQSAMVKLAVSRRLTTLDADLNMPANDLRRLRDLNTPANELRSGENHGKARFAELIRGESAKAEKAA